VLIDGGSKGVYASILSKRLAQLQSGGSLELRMAMVSHIDADHITGILDLLRALEKARDDGDEPSCAIDTLWLNSFDRLNAGTPAVAKSSAVAASIDGIIPPHGLDPFAAAVVASVPQANRVRDTATRLGISINDGAARDGLVEAPAKGRCKVTIAPGLTFTVIAPHTAQLARLKDEFAKAKAKHGAQDAALAADYLNNTVPNMSSIVVMAEAAPAGNKQPLQMLLTGDARGDVILESLNLAGYMKKGRCHVDLLKVQHHGSSHSITQDFFERVTADHYVISGNGKHGIPHPDALHWLSASRSGESYNAYLTNRIGVLGLKKTLDAFLASEAATEKRHCYHFRNEKDLSLSVALA
jgi:hypothetical protein